MHESGSNDDEANPPPVPDATDWWYGSTTRACPLESAASAAPVPPTLAAATPAGDPEETLRAANSQASWDPAALAAAEAMPSALPLYRTLLAISRSRDPR